MSKLKTQSTIFPIIFTVSIIMVITLIVNWSVIFQRGNPIPYLKSMLQLSGDQSYIEVQDDSSIVFITKRDNYDKLHEYIEDNYDVSFAEQMGSGYIFRSDEKVIIATSEIYWRYYIVWTISKERDYING